MSKADNLKDFLVDLANAIREKKNKTGVINPQDFSAEILSIIAGDVQMPNVSGTLVITEGITEDDYEALKLILGNNITIDAQGGIYIHFEDPEVLRVLLANITPNDGVGLTTAQAEGVTSIGTWFNGNTTIETFDEFEKFTGVTALKESSFMGCTALKSIKLNNITSIGRDCFKSTSLTGILNLPNVTSIDTGAFRLTNINRVGNLGLIIELPGGVETQGIFSGCKNLTDVVLPDALISIGHRTFIRCTSLRNITFGNNVTSIGDGAFGFCAFEQFEIPNTVKTIGNTCFYGCSNLKKLTIGNGIESIGNEFCVVESGSIMEVIIINAQTPPSISAGSFSKSNSCPIYVPDASVEAYKTATNWSSHADRIKGISELQTDNPTLYEEVKEYL